MPLDVSEDAGMERLSVWLRLVFGCFQWGCGSGVMGTAMFDVTIVEAFHRLSRLQTC